MLKTNVKMSSPLYSSEILDLEVSYTVIASILCTYL